MASVNAIYQHLTDELARTATITLESGTLDPAYPLPLLVDGNPAKPMKLTTTTGRIVFDLGADVAKRVALVALIHHTLDAGLTVYWEANDTDTWSSPLIQRPIVIPAWYATGTARAWPVNPWLDMSDQVWHFGDVDVVGFRYWSLNFPDANSQPIELGQIWVGEQVRRYSPNLEWGHQPKRDKRLIENTTDFGVSTYYGRGTTEWSDSGDLDATDTLHDALVAQWFDVDGRLNPWLLVPDGTVNDCYLVRHATTDQQFQRNMIDRNAQKWAFQEASRGLRLGV